MVSGGCALLYCPLQSCMLLLLQLLLLLLLLPCLLLLPTATILCHFRRCSALQVVAVPLWRAAAAGQPAAQARAG